MSDDEFIVGFPIADESSDSSFVMGGAVAPRRRVAGAPARPAIGGDGEGESTDSDDFMTGAAAPHRQTRQLERTVAQTLGSLWTIATSSDQGVAAGVGQQEAFALMRLTWALKEPNYNARNQFDVGTLEYHVDRCLPFQVSLPLPADLTSSAASTLRVVSLCAGAVLNMEGGTVKEFDEFLAAEGVSCAGLTHCTQAEVATANRVATESPRPSTLFRSWPVYSRGRYPPVIARTPSKKNFQLWRKQIRDQYKEVCHENAELMPPVGDDDPLLYLPPESRFEHFVAAEPVRGRKIGGRLETDPVRIIRAINVAQHLRQPALFQQVLEGCMDYLGLEERNATIGHDFTLDPERRPMDRALARADVVAMSLQRRLFKKWREEDFVKSINVYSDASPVVGAELQGMIIDVNLRDENTVRIVLPGSTLAYGFASSMNKSVALLHALWLVGGPEAEDVRWLCFNIRSMTTDFGVEMHLLEAPDLVDAFIAFMDGMPMSTRLVKHGTRMWPRALRVAGWSHTQGNIMKSTAEAFPDWPMYLKHMRALCKCFRNYSYRKHIAKKLGSRYPEARLDALLRSFTAGFAKWRYETVVEVLRQLLKLRDLCENKLEPELFVGAQDQDEMAAFFQACKAKDFWRWAAVAHLEIYQRLERLRKWGMVCPHERCEELRKASNYKKHIDCPRTMNILVDLLFLFVFIANTVFLLILLFSTPIRESFATSILFFSWISLMF